MTLNTPPKNSQAASQLAMNATRVWLKLIRKLSHPAVADHARPDRGLHWPPPLRSAPACSATLRKPVTDGYARRISRIPVTATFRNAIPEPQSHLT
jgi:hypothetical protein